MNEALCTDAVERIVMMVKTDLENLTNDNTERLAILGAIAKSLLCSFFIEAGECGLDEETFISTIEHIKDLCTSYYHSHYHPLTETH